MRNFYSKKRKNLLIFSIKELKYKCEKQKRVSHERISKINSEIRRRNPMIISDLNYLQTSNEEIIGGRGKGFKFDKKIKTDVQVKLDIKKDIDAKVDIKGNLADAEAYADAKGKNSLAETLTVTYASGHSSSAYSGSVSAVD
jgi:hypothetical protein